MKLSEFEAKVLGTSTVKAALEAQLKALTPKPGVDANTVKQALEFFIGILTGAMSDVIHPVGDKERDHEVPKESDVTINPSDFRAIKGLEALSDEARLVRLRCHFIEEGIRTFVASMPLFTNAKDIEKHLRDLVKVVIPAAASIRGIKMKREYVIFATFRK